MLAVLDKLGSGLIVNHMVKCSPPALDATFGALGDSTRRGILTQLRRGETSVSDLAAPYRVSLPAVSKHLRVLEQAGLIVREKKGRTHYCRLSPDPMRNAAEWLDRYRRFWDGRLASLKRYVEEGEDPNKVEEDV